MQFDTATLVAVLVASNLLVAAALWIAFPGSLRRTLRLWTGALVVHAAAWALLLAASRAALVVAGAALVYGWTLQASRALEFHGRRLPASLHYGLPVIALGRRGGGVLRGRPVAADRMAFGISNLAVRLVWIDHCVVAGIRSHAQGANARTCEHR